MRLNQRLVSSIFCVGFLCAPLLAQGAHDSQAGTDAKLDYATTRREIRSFEAVINEVINNTFTSPFALSQKPKGAYLPGYGMSFNFLVNIHRALISTPFGQIKKDQITSTEKKRRIEELKAKLIQVLLDSGKRLPQLRREDAITIVAFIEDRNFPDEPNENKTVVMTVMKKDLDGASAKSDGAVQDFERKVKVLEY
jgi:hypothetical protein